MKDSWRESRTWLRRATLTNISAIEPRSAACSRAIFIVVWFTSLNAAASRPTSSCEVDRDPDQVGVGRLARGGHGLDQARQLVADLAGRVGQVPQRPGDGPGDDQGEHDRQQQDEQGQAEDLPGAVGGGRRAVGRGDRGRGGDVGAEPLQRCRGACWPG